MYSLPELRQVQALIAEREATDAEFRWLWQIRRKVLSWSIATLEHNAELKSAVEPMESAAHNSTPVGHPLLQLPATTNRSAFEPDMAWRKDIAIRVQRFIASVRSRAQ